MKTYYKIIIVGNSGVGKTTLVTYLYSGYYQENITSTVGASFIHYPMTIDGNRTSVHIWDTAGQERYKSLVHLYYRDSDAAIFVFDVCNRRSFLDLDNWFNSYQDYNNNKNFTTIIVCNKTDFPEDKWEVSKEEIAAFAEKKNTSFIFTSCISGTNVRKVFEDITRQLLKSTPISVAKLDAIKLEYEKSETMFNKIWGFCTCT